MNDNDNELQIKSFTNCYYFAVVVSLCLSYYRFSPVNSISGNKNDERNKNAELAVPPLFCLVNRIKIGDMLRCRVVVLFIPYTVTSYYSFLCLNKSSFKLIF